MASSTRRLDGLADLIRSNLPTDEEMAQRHGERLEQANGNPTCFTHWFPVVRELGIPHPRSFVIDFPDTLNGQILNEQFDVAEESLRAIVASIRRAGEQFGYPLFLKNSLFSGKHQWPTTCFIPEHASDEAIIGRIVNLTHFWGCVGFELALYLVVREFIPTRPVFHAFGGMPITTEFRLFAADGRLQGWQPYWPAASIVEPDAEDWEQRLAVISEPAPEALVQMGEWAKAVTARLGGSWSVDFLCDRDGQFWLIDMAEGHKSFRCPHGYREVAW